MGYHTILLVQRDASPTSRMYFDLTSTQLAMERVVKLFEARLKNLNPNRPHITYDVGDLFAYIDGLADLSALVLDDATGQYTPHSKEWIKGLLWKYFQAQAT